MHALGFLCGLGFGLLCFDRSLFSWFGIGCHRLSSVAVGRERFFSCGTGVCTVGHAHIHMYICILFPAHTHTDTAQAQEPGTSKNGHAKLETVPSPKPQQFPNPVQAIKSNYGSVASTALVWTSLVCFG